jgi:MFS transporter, MHS family, shikimate and dehydroshikimate transport protein
MSVDEQTVAARPVPTRPRGLSPRGVGFAALFGNTIELYDFVIYAYVGGAVFGPLFFPTDVPWVGTVLAFTTQALAFFVRPLGAVVFGRIGDRWGRRAPLLWSVTIMGGATVAIGLLPTYATAGAAAPVMLLILRLVQGIAIGGEYPGAVVVAVEHAPEHRKTLYGALPQIGNMLGSLLAASLLVAVNLAAGPEVWRAWAWRVPFLCSVVLVVIGLVLRTRLSETPEFTAATAEPRPSAPFAALLRRSAEPLVIGILFWLGPLTFSYAFLNSLIAFVASWRPRLSPLDPQIGLVLSSALLVVVVAVIARFGDRLGLERVALASGICITAWAVPSYLLIDLQNPAALWLAMAVGSLAYGAFGGVAPRLMALLFPVRFRFLGVGVCIAASGVLAGAVLPVPALAWVGRTGGSSVPLMLMVITAGCASVVGVIWLKSYRKRVPTM